MGWSGKVWGAVQANAAGVQNSVLGPTIAGNPFVVVAGAAAGAAAAFATNAAGGAPAPVPEAASPFATVPR